MWCRETRKYIRNRGYGGSVRTTDQAKVKSVFKMLAAKWRTLTNEQILAWTKLALSQEGRRRWRAVVAGPPGQT